jgi:hypothetical protein
MTMEPTFLVAEMYSKGSLSGLASSALPDAPVRPAHDRRRRTRRTLGAVRQRRSRFGWAHVTPAQPECSPAN